MSTIGPLELAAGSRALRTVLEKNGCPGYRLHEIPLWAHLSELGRSVLGAGS